MMFFANLEKVNPQFRTLTDLLLFSDRKDLDLSEFNSLLKSNYSIHINYFWDKFLKSSQICWESKVWFYRINFILSLNNKNFSKKVENYLKQKMLNLVKFKNKIDPEYDTEYLQFLELCKVKKAKKQSLHAFKLELIALTNYSNYDKVFQIINSVIPFVFSSYNEYINLLCKNILSYPRNIEFLYYLHQKNIDFDKSVYYKIFLEVLPLKKSRNRQLLFSLINNPEARQKIKENYTEQIKSDLIKSIKGCNSSELESVCFKPIKNLLEIDELLAEPLLDVYANSLYSRYAYHKRANVDKLNKLIKFVPEINAKKVLAWLSNHRNSDLKYFLRIFPELKKLATFA